MALKASIALLSLARVISATMQYGTFITYNGVTQKIAWISGQDVCKVLVRVVAEGGDNACDINFTIPNNAANGYTFSFENCNSAGVPQALNITPGGSPTYQVQGDGISEHIGCSGGQQFSGGQLANQFPLPF